MTTVLDVEDEDAEKYEVVHGSGSMTSSSSVAVEFVVTAESLCQLCLVQRDGTEVSAAAQQQDCHSAISCLPGAGDGAGTVVTTAH